MTCRSLATIAAVAIAVAAPLCAQGAAPCKNSPCVYRVDWGGGKTSASYPQDRRYGSAEEFDRLFRSALTGHGYSLADGATDGVMTMNVRPTMKERVMCDQVRGLNPDMTCTAMTNVAVSFSSTDPSVKAPGTISVTNRCGQTDVFLTMKVFAQYAADLVWWQLEGQAAKADRPSSKC